MAPKYSSAYAISHLDEPMTRRMSPWEGRWERGREEGEEGAAPEAAAATDGGPLGRLDAEATAADGAGAC